MRYLRGEMQARQQAVSVTKLATSVASIKIPGAASLWSATAPPPLFSAIVGRLILFRCGDTFARKLMVRDESRRLKKGNTSLRFKTLIARRTMNWRRFALDLRPFGNTCLICAQ